MRFFFRSRKFKILMASVAALLVIVITVSLITSVSSPISSFISTVTTPVQKTVTSVSDKLGDWKKQFGDNEALAKEIERLEAEKAELAGQLTEMEQIRQENEFYEQFLGIKEKNSEMLFQAASVVARDNTDPYKTFTIDVGLINGVAKYDPVITPDGLVGYITETAPTYSKVTTVLSPRLKAGGRDNRTADEGIISGKAELAKDGSCYIYNLQRDCTVSIGDYIVTAGGGVFPDGLIVGTVSDIKQQSKDTSLYAVVDSAVDFDDIRNVMVITYFSGQGMTGPDGGTK